MVIVVVVVVVIVVVVVVVMIIMIILIVIVVVIVVVVVVEWNSRSSGRSSRHQVVVVMVVASSNSNQNADPFKPPASHGIKHMQSSTQLPKSEGGRDKEGHRREEGQSLELVEVRLGFWVAGIRVVQLASLFRV